ncbi:P-loop containing nucleoside triphosphate hydrolase protein [Paraphysoderma sedebokerense]|nr:P-loop containing nucleoside triphosphate hydrolase protein [Paraphysoderma sedebokerense]
MQLAFFQGIRKSKVHYSIYCIRGTSIVSCVLSQAFSTRATDSTPAITKSFAIPKRPAPNQNELLTGDYFFSSPITLLPNYIEVRNATIPEVAFLGPSNAGKSSLLNTVINRLKHKISRISSKPGSTRKMLFYSLKNRLMLVDMMGYGQGSRLEWGKITEEYLLNRPNLKHVFLLLPSHKPLSDFDRSILSLLSSSPVPFTMVLTQIDQLHSTDAFLSKLEKMNVTRQLETRNCNDILCTSVQRFIPRWNLKVVGMEWDWSTVQDNSLPNDIEESTDLNKELGYVTWTKAQLRMPRSDVDTSSEKLASVGKTSAHRRKLLSSLHLNKPGVSEMRWRILQQTGINTAKWMSKMKAAGLANQ